MATQCNKCARNEPQGCPFEKEHLEEAANRAAKKVFYILGVDIDAPSEVEEFRENLRFSATIKKTATNGIVALLGVLITAAVSAILSYIYGRFFSN